MSIWRPRTTGILIGGVVVVILAAAISFIVTNFQPRTDVQVGSGDFSALLATNDVTRQAGLSGFTSLKPNDALLMAFPSDDIWGIWMKDMKVPIDILWLNSNKKVIYIVTNASPDLGTSKVFKPLDKARYVLEIPAGAAAQDGIKVGATAQFTVDEGSVK
jgi:uncharacterized membrane protein (UPF0127 family)